MATLETDPKNESPEFNLDDVRQAIERVKSKYKDYIKNIPPELQAKAQADIEAILEFDQEALEIFQEESLERNRPPKPNAQRLHLNKLKRKPAFKNRKSKIISSLARS